MSKSLARTTALVLAAGGLGTAASGQVLYNNGPIVTLPVGACVPTGQNTSAMQGTANTFGFGFNGAAGALLRLADDFVVPAGGWTVTGFNVYGYQTGSPTAPSTFTGASCQIWNGRPGDPGSVVVAGNAIIGPPAASVFDSTYRHTNAACGLTRPIMKTTVNLAGGPAVLAPGTYWVDFSTTGSLASGPFSPPVTNTGAPTPVGGNARQLVTAGTVWQDVVDAGAGVPNDMPFQVLGTGTPVLSGRCCMPDGTCQLMSAGACAGVGGTYGGNSTLCSSGPCPIPPTGACCTPTGCSIRIQVHCQTNFIGGVYLGDNSTCTGCASTAPPVIISNCNVKTGSQSLSGVVINAPDPGSEWSEAARDGVAFDLANSVAGFSAGGVNRLADDFTVPTGGITLQYVRVYGYTTSATAAGATKATLRILDGSPVGTPNVVFGDTTTNRMAGNQFSNIYRIFNSMVGAGIGAPCVAGAGALPGLTRRLQTIDIAVNQFLAAGTYWVDFNYQGVGFSPPTVNATAIGRQCDPVAANNNALQNTGTWAAIVDGGVGCNGGAPVTATAPANVAQGVYFELLGTLGGGPSCYANCDLSTGNPLLTANDFVCFITKYANNDSTANCDQSTGNPLLTANDFVCFIAAYASNCS